jgi:hypothetical protein
MIALLLVLVAPAVTSMKSSNDVNSAAYTIRDTLQTARSYAKANNTYTWIGFYEENGSQVSSNPAIAGSGRIVLSIIASKDGTDLGANPKGASGTNNWLDSTRLIQVTKLIKIDNVHFPLFAMCSVNCNGSSFDTRPALQNDPVAGYNASRFGELNAAGPDTAPYDSTNNGLTRFPFWYPLTASSQAQAQYTFRRTLQFSPRGECRINSTYDFRTAVELGCVQTHGSSVPTPASGAGTSNAVYAGNVVAIQIAGFGGAVKIYRR